jgi:hypothetical protein
MSYSRGERLPQSVACGVVVPFCCCVFERFILVFWRHYYCKSLYYILWHWLFCIHFIYGIVETCSWVHILCAFDLALKSGVTEWYQIRVDCRNTSLVRRVIFSSLFYNQNYFYATLSKTSILQLIFSFYLIFSSTSIIHMANNGSCNSNNCDNNDIENPPSMLEQLLIIQAQLLWTIQ